MEGKPLKKMLLFNAHADLTFLELKTWRSFLCTMVGANQAYFDHLTEATDGLKMFSEFCNVYNTGTGKNSYPAAERVSGMVQKMADFHKEVLGNFEKYTGQDGPFADVFKSTDEEFEQLKKKSTSHYKEHKTMEKETEKAWKRYARKNKKKIDFEKKLAHLSEEELKEDKNWMKLDQQVDQAYTSYNTCFENEITHRKTFYQQMEEVKKEYLIREKRQLDIMFSLINQSLGKLHKLLPAGLQEIEELDFEPEKSNTRKMARKNWDAYLKEYTFPERMDVTANPGDYEDEDDTDSDDRSVDEDSDDSGDGYRGHRGVRSLRAPKLTNEQRGMNDVLHEILASLDDRPDGTRRSNMESGVMADHNAEFAPVPERHFDSSQKENVTVLALKNWDKTNSTEISIRVGMKLKQTKATNANGMAYGYKKTIIGLKKYGFYPADMVTLSLRDARLHKMSLEKEIC